jgi:hypothetical protein
VRAVRKQGYKTYLKDLVAAISIRDLQERFNRNAERKLEELAKMVGFMLRIDFLANVCRMRLRIKL